MPQPPHSAPECPRGPSDLPRPPGTSPYQPLGVGVALNTSGRNPPPSSKQASYDRGYQPDIKPRLRPCGRLLVYKDVEDSLLCHISKPQLLKCKWRRDMTKMCACLCDPLSTALPELMATLPIQGTWDPPLSRGPPCGAPPPPHGVEECLKLYF